ncbi:MAG: glycosyltransferase family 4 protein, partial [Candidatus Dormibacteria bacterium]
RRDILEHYRLPEDRVVAIPNAPGPAGKPIGPEAARSALRAIGLDASRPYLLSVGTLQPRKNLSRLFDAYAALRAAGEFDGDLVVAGPPGYRADDLHPPGGVTFTGYVDERTLAALFRLSAGFVMPSLYEAFGIPVVEAMSHGVPVACSTGGALPEVCGGAALMFDPTDTDGMAATMGTLVSDTLARQRLKDSGLARAAELDWAATARATANVYREAASW